MDNITKQNGNEVGKRQVEGQTIIINQQERRSTNGLGTAGFILALLGLMAVAGLVISCIALIVLIILVSAIVSLV